MKMENLAKAVQQWFYRYYPENSWRQETEVLVWLELKEVCEAGSVSQLEFFLGKYDWLPRKKVEMLFKSVLEDAWHSSPDINKI